MRTLTFLAEGQLECPTLFLIHPMPKPGAAKPIFFPEPIKLYFLCGYSMQPIDADGCVVDIGGASQALDFLKEAAPTVKIVLNVLKGIAATTRIVSGLSLEGLLPSSLTDGADGESLLDRIDNAKEWADGVASTVAGDEDVETLDSLDSVLEFAEAETTTKEQRLALRQAQTLTGSGFAKVKELAEKQGVLKKLPMTRLVDADGTVTWCARCQPRVATIPIRWLICTIAVCTGCTSTT